MRAIPPLLALLMAAATLSAPVVGHMDQRHHYLGGFSEAFDAQLNAPPAAELSAAGVGQEALASRVAETAQPCVQATGVPEAGPAPHDPYVGAVCFPVGHLVPRPGGDGTVIIQVEDEIVRPAAFSYCQDTSGDGVCHALDDYVDAGRCGSITLVTGENWDPSLAVHIILGGPTHGIVDSSCHAATTGEVVHNP